MATATQTRRAGRQTRGASDAQLDWQMEASGFLLAAVGLLCTLSIVGHALGHRGGEHNWIGPVGDRLAWLLLGGLGVGAFPVAMGVLALGGGVLVGWRPHPRVRSVLLGAVLFGTSLVLIDLVVAGRTWFGYAPGGLVGHAMAEGLVALFSRAGTAVVAGTGWLAALVALTRRPLRSLLAPVLVPLHFVATALRGGLGAARGAVGRIADAIRARRERRAAPPEGEAEASPTEPQASAPQPTRRRRPRGEQRRAPEGDARDRAGEPVDRLRPASDDVDPDDPPVGPPADASQAAPAAPQSKPEDAAPSGESGKEPRARKGNEGPREPRIVESEAMRRRPSTPTGPVAPAARAGDWKLPPLDLLHYEPPARNALTPDELRANAHTLEQKLADFGVAGSVVEIHPGPVVTMYEFKPAPGVKISKIANLSDDLSMALAATRVRIVAPIPGKSVVGIEVPNRVREMVYLREIMADEAFQRSQSPLTLALGKDIVGYPTVADLARMPHLLVAGATGSGKSVAINSFICSILFRATPDQVRLILVDPKMLELNLYDGIPHLLLPVVTEPKKAAQALAWAVGEMERRYRLLASLGVRNITGYNKRVEELREEYDRRMRHAQRSLRLDASQPDDEPLEEPPDKLPIIVIIIDELADLMMVASRDVETAIARLAQMARAAGIHLILATQRPSVDVITGLIKANFPSRISFRVSSRVDSRTILDAHGAENLLGQGDMLFLTPGAMGLKRIHGSFVGEAEIARVTAFLKQQGQPQYCMEILQSDDEAPARDQDEDYDELYDQAVRIVAETRNASISYLQRRLKIGYNRAARIMETMEREGVVGPANGPGPREVYIDPV